MKVAIIHYWLVTMRGGEKVVEELLRIFPEADIFTHVYVPQHISPQIKQHRIFTSHINKLPFASKLYQKYMPLMPNALNEFDLSEYDLIISSESGPAKGIIPNPDAFHICYCHSPMRYIWDMYHTYFHKAGFLTKFFMKRIIPSLRLWDIASSHLVDHFIANSHYVAKRIMRYYGRQADIIFPPVNIDQYTDIARNPQDFYLFFGQLVGYKRADIAINACLKSNRKLILAGDGASSQIKQKYKNNPLITFLGRVSDDDIKKLFSQAKALLFPGIEDLGLIPIEANAAGCPVIAFRRGGALDTVKENITGIFFDQQTPESLIDALDRFESLPPDTFADRQQFTNHVQQFSREAFIERIQQVVSERKRI